MTVADLPIGTHFIEEIDGLEFEITTQPQIHEGLVSFIGRDIESDARREFTFKDDQELILA